MPNGSDNPLNEAYKESMTDELDPVEIPIDGVLDLHTFQPREVKDLVSNYLELCREKGMGEIRIIHGKGSGQLRRTVHSILSKNRMVHSFCLAGEDGGGWGATMVQLRRPGEEKPSNPPAAGAA